MNVIKYLYYRLVMFYKKHFNIDESPYFLIQSCYSWGLLVLLISFCFYLMSIECIIIWWMGFKMKKAYILFTMLPFAIFHVFSEYWIRDEKKLFEELCKKYNNDRFELLKGILVFLFVTFSLPCYFATLFLCK